MVSERILVTGAQGFVGRYLVAHLLANDPTAIVIGVGRSPEFDQRFTHVISGADGPVPAPLPAAVAEPIRRGRAAGRYVYLRADLTDPEAVGRMMAEAAPEVLVHNAAALHHADGTSLTATNVDGTRRLLRATAAAPRLRRLVMVSSGGVYGVPAQLPISEDSVPQPIDPYSQSKLASEVLVQAHVDQRGWECAIGRVFNVVGAGQDENHLCGKIAAELAAAGEGAGELTLGSLHATRDLVDVDDVGRALAAMSQRPLTHRIYNVASGRETLMRDVVEQMLALHPAGARFAVREGEPRPHNIPRHYGDISRITALGGGPQRSLPHSLAAVLDYYRRGQG